MAAQAGADVSVNYVRDDVAARIPSGKFNRSDENRSRFKPI
jgi:hypothetical protein